MAAIVLGLCLVTLKLGERIGINDGQGWDGMGYTAWAQDFWQHIVVEGVSRYSAQRVLPSAVVHYAMRAAGVAPTAHHAIAGFQALDTTVLVIAAALWAHLGHAMRWRRVAIWVGFVALFACFANARHALYYPTLTDPTAFLLGLVVAWAYLLGHPIALWCATAAAAFTFPALLPVALVLLVLPRRTDDASAEPRRWHRYLAAGLAVVGTAIFLTIARRSLAHPVPGFGLEKFAAWVLRDLLVLTVPLLVAWLAGGWYTLLAAPRLWDVRGYLRQLRVRRTAIAIVAIGVLLVARSLVLATTGRNGEGGTTAQFLCEHTIAALRGPLWGPVHHVVYYGPIILVAILQWRRIAAVVSGWGPAVPFALAIGVAFAAGSQSRQWNHLFALVVVATIAATHALWTPRRAVLFALLCLAWSKLGFTIGYDQPLVAQEFPNQRYFMTQGPWATTEMYLVHLAGAAVTLVFVWLLLRAPSPPRQVEEHAGAEER